MFNFTLAGILHSIAEMHKGKDGNDETVIEFTKAARSVLDYDSDITNALSNGEFNNIAGIGRNAGRVLEEYFATGKVAEYEKIKELYSDDLIRMVRVSGLGRRRVFTIYDQLNIKNVDDLKNCIEDCSIYNRILDNPQIIKIDKNFITRENIDRFIFSLNYYETAKSFFPKGYTEYFLKRVTDGLLSFKEIENVWVTGSVRRKKAFIRDIDILVLPVFNFDECDFLKSENLLKKLINLEFFRELIKVDRREQNISARYKTIFDIDIEVILTTHKRYSLDLFTTTGSRDHVADILNLFRKKKDCIKAEDFIIENAKNYTDKPGTKEPENSSTHKFDYHNYYNSNKNELKTNMNTEPEDNSDDFLIYRMLDMQYVPPELREDDSGIIRLAEKHAVPRLIKLADIKGDLHIHSGWSDGLIEIKDIVSYCRTSGYEYLAISDHSVSNKYGDGLDSSRIIEKINYMRQISRDIKGISVLTGSEVDIAGAGKLDYSDDILSKLDFVIGAMHSNYLNKEGDNTARVIGAIENKYVDAIAHPTGVLFATRAPYQMDVDLVMENALKNKKALEINSYLLRLDLDEARARQFKSMGGKIIINTDSHRYNNLAMMKLGVEVARRAGLDRDDIINTLSLKDLNEWRKTREYKRAG